MLLSEFDYAVEKINISHGTRRVIWIVYPQYLSLCQHISMYSIQIR